MIMKTNECLKGKVMQLIDDYIKYYIYNDKLNRNYNLSKLIEFMKIIDDKKVVIKSWRSDQVCVYDLFINDDYLASISQKSICVPKINLYLKERFD